jgi:uncharacterized protein (DUF2147 family)
MKRWIIGAGLAFGLAGGAAADPALGTWKTGVDGEGYAHVKMAKCGSNICGKIAKTFDTSGQQQPSDLIGRTIVIDMAPNGDGSYNGKVYRPSDDRTFIGKMSVSGQKLALSGCVLGGLICAKQTWTRVN